MSLEVHDLEVRLKEGSPLLGPLSLRLAPGQRVGLAGASGCSKSLLVRTLFGVLPAGTVLTSGSLSAWGVPLDFPSPARDEVRGRRMGWVPQDPLQALNPHLEVRDHLALLRSPHPRVTPQEALLERLRLPTDTAFFRRRPHELSGGQRQRLCWAMALGTEPELLILDEPTTALDPLLQAECITLMHELQRQRPFGWLWISHDLGVLEATCEELLVMERGRIVASGPTAQLLTEPKHPCTARLIAASPDRPLEESRPA